MAIISLLDLILALARIPMKVNCNVSAQWIQPINFVCWSVHLSYLATFNIIAPIGGPKKVLAHKTGEIMSGRARKRFATSWRHDVIASWVCASQFFIYLSLNNTLWLIWRDSVEKSGKNDFYANMTSARHDVMTSSTFFHNLICAYTISIFSDLFGEIQWEKSAKTPIFT